LDGIPSACEIVLHPKVLFGRRQAIHSCDVAIVPALLTNHRSVGKGRPAKRAAIQLALRSVAFGPSRAEETPPSTEWRDSS